MAEVSQFQPLLPNEKTRGPLLELAGELVREAHQLGGQPGTALRSALTPRLRAMNSYYTNKIEGQHTRPADIERALQKSFAADAALARKQRLAVAHIAAEEHLEAAVTNKAPAELFDSAFVREIHEKLYSELPDGDRVTDENRRIVPGKYRNDDVAAGRHVAPRHQDVASLIDAWAQHYCRIAGNEALLVAVACAHHRLAWVHPFIDGNGRVARLHTHLLLHSMGLTQGLWSPMRGLARRHEEYFARLHSADMPRRDDLDGRGVLSQEELVAFARYFLNICLDQVRFMSERFGFASLKENLASLLVHLRERPWQIGSEKSVIKIEALEALHYVAIAGPLERSRFVAMTGLGERTGRRVLASLLSNGILAAESPREPVRFALPLTALRFLFPNLWPESAVS